MKYKTILNTTVVEVTPILNSEKLAVRTSISGEVAASSKKKDVVLQTGQPIVQI